MQATIRFAGRLLFLADVVTQGLSVREAELFALQLAGDGVGITVGEKGRGAVRLTQPPDRLAD